MLIANIYGGLYTDNLILPSILYETLGGQELAQGHTSRKLYRLNLSWLFHSRGYGIIFWRRNSAFSLSFSFFFLALPHSIWDLSSPTRDQTHTPCSGSAES